VPRRRGRQADLPFWVAEELAAEKDGIVPLESNALALRFTTLRPGPDLAMQRPEQQEAQAELLQTPSQVTIIHPVDQQVRRIYLDVPHSRNPGHTWYGESVGHYEGGDTLVVDTIGMNDKTQTDRFGTPHSDQMHVVERYRVAGDHRTLEVQFTVDDPTAFTRAWTGELTMVRAPGPIYACHEGNYGMVNLLRGARAEEKTAAEAARKKEN